MPPHTVGVKDRTGYNAKVIEPLRLCIVLFFAGLGSEVGTFIRSRAGLVAGELEPQAVGLLLGVAVGYVLGGVLARFTVRGLRDAEKAIIERSPERIIGGIVGMLFGVFVAAGLGWPLLLIGHGSITIPLFLFALLATAILGFRVGGARRHTLMRMLSGSAAMSSPVQTSQGLDRIIDTSVAIDGRLVDVIRAGFLHGTFVVPHPVLAELQGLADADDETRRTRGRRGLEILDALRRERGIEFEVVPDGARETPEVDAKLVRMCLDRPGVLVTLDTNLAKAASLAGCRVMNLHALALALRPPVSAGDAVSVLMTKPGREAGQAVGYLDDGTMVVVERARAALGKELSVVVTSVLTTANGRMVFAKRAEGPVRHSAAVNEDVNDSPSSPEVPAQAGGDLTPAAIAARVHGAGGRSSSS